LAGKEISIYSPDGIFDFIYAKDSAKGILKLALESKLSGVVNLGTGKGHHVKDIIKVLLRNFPKMNSKILESPLQVEASQADMSKFFQETGWLPEYSLERAIGEIIEYEKSKPTRFLIDGALNILVTSSSSKTPLIRLIQKAAENIDQKIKVIAADSSKNVVSRFVVDSFWEMPILDNANTSEIIEYCLQSKIGLVIPTRDGELDYWAENKSKFGEKGITILISNPNTIKICLDKIYFYEFMSEIFSNLIPTASNIDSLSRTDSYVVKERYGAGSKKIGIGLSYPEALNKSLSLESPIFQPLVIGKEISADIWIIPNYYESVVLRYRVLVEGGESKITKIFRNTVLEEEILNLAKKLEIIGPAVIQAIIDDSGVAHIIECNPRIGGASTASIAAGTNSFVKMISHYILGEQINKIGEIDKIHELIQVRTSIDEYFYDIDI
jgi:carbamoyl-phosphate synthase large subunit